MKLSLKIIGGFGTLSAIALALGITGFIGATKTSHTVEEVTTEEIPAIEALQVIKLGGEQVASAQRALLDLSLSQDLYTKEMQAITTAREVYGEAWKKFEQLPHEPEEKALWDELQPAWQAWRAVNSEVFKTIEQLRAMDLGDPRTLRASFERFRGDHYKLLFTVQNAIREKKPFTGGDDHTQCNYGKWRSASRTTNAELLKLIEATDSSHQQFHALVKQVQERIGKEQVDQHAAELAKQVQAQAEQTLAQIDKMGQLAAQVEQLAEATRVQAITVVRQRQMKANEVLDRLMAGATANANAATAKATEVGRNVRTLCILATGGGLIVAGLLSFFLTRAITRPIHRVAGILSEGTEQTASASTQVAGASQSLAQGASEQAAALEETSSSLEEMSSMTRKNAETAQQASTLSAEAKKSADDGNAAMIRMSAAIADIQKSASETAKIIKVIDEIAFQTNLLALNAAVEAARAGEAGKGFAVVAEEVRNLAMRSAEAAKNTASLIEQSVNNSRNGVSIAEDVGKVLAEINSSNTKVNALIGEIAAASSEQARGIDQVNTAVAQMDKVTQSNASNAEESASAAEELSAQAEQMRGVVNELLQLVGAASREEASTMRAARSPDRGRKAANPPTSARRSEARKLIPLDETEGTSGDFSEFSKAA